LLLIVVLASGPLAAQAEEARPADKPLRVAADGSGDFKTIQEAVDKAAPGAVIRIAAGTHAGPVRITKPLTLEGAGWNTTEVASAYDASGFEDMKARAELESRMDAAKTDEERVAARREFLAKYGPKPVLYLGGAGGVTVRGLRIALTGDVPEEGVVMFGWAVAVEGGKAAIESCAVMGSPASGIGVSSGADVTVKDCLIAGVWSTGIEVGNEPGQDTRARIVGCTVRNCHHRGITLYGVDRRSLVEGCAISGSAWHGIRYDHASPVIRGNRIFANARCGIYASGRTEALVTGNVFVENEMTGMSCYHGSRDCVEGNTFARNRRSGIEVLGSSAPTIERNVFFANPTAVLTGHIADEGARSQYVGPTAVRKNVFWKNEKNGYWGAESERKKGGDETDPAKEAARLAAGGENRLADPKFADPASGDYTLPPDSPARAIQAGAGPVPGTGSDWPLLPAEKVMLASREAEEAEEGAEELSWKAHQMAWPWIEDVMQLSDAARREKALARIAKALDAKDRLERCAGLQALAATADARIDRARFRERAADLARSGQGQERMKAIHALYVIGAKDVARNLLNDVLRTAPGSLGEGAWQLLVHVNDGEITGAAAELLLSRLSNRRDTRGIAFLLAELQDARRLSPALEARMIELATRGPFELRSRVIYFVLSRLDPKSPAVVKTLIRLVEDPDPPDPRGAMSGLAWGIGPESRPIVADFFVRFLATRERTEDERHAAIRALARVAGPDQRPQLEAILANERASAALHEAVKQLIEHLRERDAKSKETKDG